MNLARAKKSDPRKRIENDILMEDDLRRKKKKLKHMVVDMNWGLVSGPPAEPPPPPSGRGQESSTSITLIISYPCLKNRTRDVEDPGVSLTS